jgi:hypothetical protein
VSGDNSGVSAAGRANRSVRLNPRLGDLGAVTVAVAVVVAAGPFGTRMPTFGLDPGWQLALGLAQLERLRFGEDLLFTFGPWGYIDYALPLSTWQVVTGAVFRTLSLLTFLWSLQRATSFLPGRRSLLVAAVATSLLAPWSASDWLLAVAVSVIAAHEALLGRPLTWRMLIVAGLLLPFLFLVKVSSGLVAIAVVGMALLAGRQWRGAFAFAGLMLAGLIGWWLAAGQAMAAIVPWLRSTAEIITGYPEAMSWGGLTGGWIIVLGAVVALGASLPGTIGNGRQVLRALPLVVALVLGARVSIVRLDVLHYGQFVVLVVALTLVGAQRANRRFVARLVAALVLAVLGLLAARATPVVAENWWASARAAVSPTAREDQLEQAGAAMREEYDASAEVLAALEGHPVHVDPWEIGFAWAYDLDWTGVPVVQPYSAYSRDLDERNARALLRLPDQAVVREVMAIDGRQQAWDSPAYNLALLCHFTEDAADDRWTVFVRAEDRCSPATPVHTVEVGADTPVPAPSVDDRDALLLRFEPTRQDVGQRIREALLKPTTFLEVTLGGETFRLPRALAGQPSLIRVPASEPWWAEPLPAATFLRFSEPGVVTFEVVTVKAAR